MTNKFFKEVEESKYPIIIYESPHRIIKTLNSINPETEVIVGRELTKNFETIYRGKVKDVVGKIKPKGEFVIVIKNMK